MHKDASGTPFLLPDHDDPPAQLSPDTSLRREKANESPLARFSFLPSDPMAQPNTSSRPERWPDQGSTSTASPALSQPFDNILPAPASLSERSTSRDTLSADTAKRRPLPTPPSPFTHLPSLPHVSEPIPSSPPPPYSSTLPADDPIQASPDLTRLSSASAAAIPPEAPVILAPPPDEQAAQSRAPYDSFLCHSPPANTWITVETSHAEYTLLVRLPGFRRDGITLATKRRRILHVVADSWEPEGGHFERRVSFGYDAELTQVRAEFDGEILRIIVPRRTAPVIVA